MAWFRWFHGSYDCTAIRRVIQWYISRALWTAVKNNCPLLGTNEILSVRNLWLKRKMRSNHNQYLVYQLLASSSVGRYYRMRKTAHKKKIFFIVSHAVSRYARQRLEEASVLLKTKTFDNVFPEFWLAQHAAVGNQPLYHALQQKASRRCGGLLIRALVSRSRGLGSSSSWWQCLSPPGCLNAYHQIVGITWDFCDGQVSHPLESVGLHEYWLYVISLPKITYPPNDHQSRITAHIHPVTTVRNFWRISWC